MDREQVKAAILLLEPAGRAMVVIAGVLYVVGLLIVNIYFGQYGVSNLGLLRTDYALSGALWAFLVCLAYMVLSFVRFRISAIGKMRQAGAPLRVLVWEVVWTAAVFVAIPELLFSVLTWHEFPSMLSLEMPNPRRRVYLILLVTAFNIQVVRDLAVGTLPSWLWGSTRVSAGNEGLGTWTAARWRGVVALAFTGSLFLGSFAAYALYAYPVLPRAFGGGRGMTVDLAIKRDQVPSLRQQNLPWRTETTIGPIELVIDTPNRTLIAFTDGDQPVPETRRHIPSPSDGWLLEDPDSLKVATGDNLIICRDGDGEVYCSA